MTDIVDPAAVLAVVVVLAPIVLLWMWTSTE